MPPAVTLLTVKTGLRRRHQAGYNFAQLKQLIILDALRSCKQCDAALEDQLALGEVAIQSVSRRMVFAAPC
jgi:hypothetical protein